MPADGQNPSDFVLLATPDGASPGSAAAFSIKITRNHNNKNGIGKNLYHTIKKGMAESA